MRGRNDPARPRPPDPVPRQQRDAVLRLDYVGSAPYRRSAAGCGGGGRGVRGDGKINAEQGAHPCRRGGGREANSSSHRVPVGRGKGSDATLGGTRDQFMRVRCPEPGGIPARDMQLGTSAHHAPPPENPQITLSSMSE
ncbi:hypothetical protein GCM10010264_63430 [Streptomyces globisporus]|nr:hypothetical protein GCM10010264_63430 [Streptomyces globisporus]